MRTGNQQLSNSVSVHSLDHIRTWITVNSLEDKQTHRQKRKYDADMQGREGGGRKLMEKGTGFSKA